MFPHNLWNSQAATRHDEAMRALAWIALAGCGLTSIDARAPAPTTTRAAPFSLQAHTGATVTLGSELEKGDVVLVFYRGHW
jgi:hypothetical protein